MPTAKNNHLSTTALLQTHSRVEAVLVESTNRHVFSNKPQNIAKPKNKRSTKPGEPVYAKNPSSLRLDHGILKTRNWVPFDENTTGRPNYFLTCGNQKTSPIGDDFVFSPTSVRHSSKNNQDSSLSFLPCGSDDRYAVLSDRDPLKKKRTKNQHHNPTTVDKSVAHAWLAQSPEFSHQGFSAAATFSTASTSMTTTTTNSSLDWDTSSSIDTTRATRGVATTTTNKGHGSLLSAWAEKSAGSMPLYCGFRRVYDNSKDGTNPTYASTGNLSTTHRRRRNSNSTTHSNRSRMASKWKSAKDPKSGRTYYFHTETRETQWRKPMELASQEEREEMESKERHQKNFFAAMEANILKNLSALPKKPASEKKRPEPKKTTVEKPRMVRTISSMDENVLRDLTRVPSRRRSSSEIDDTSSSTRSLGVGDLEALQVRLDPLLETSREIEESQANFGEQSISCFDINSDDDSSGDLLGESFMNNSSNGNNQDSLTFEEMQALTKVELAAEEMKQNNDSELVQSMPSRLVHPSSSSSTTSSSSANNATSPPKASTVTRPKMLKRNTCGTLYVGTTMSAPDKDATIKCVCGVFRAHILQSATEEAANFMGPIDEDPSSFYLIFNDFSKERQPTGGLERLSLDEAQSIPTLDEITGFYRDVFRRSQMETDCIIMSLIYVERLIKDTMGALRPRVCNWRSILFSCMVLSSKVWDDLSMWNADFSQTCPAGIKIFTLHRINQLEIALLQALKYNVKVKSSEYAKYYFLTRSMIIKSGLGGDDLASMAPLDVEGAKKLEQVSSNFSHSMTQRPGRLRATKSLDHAARTAIIKAQLDNDSSSGEHSPVRDKGGVSLEHIVNM